MTEDKYEVEMKQLREAVERLACAWSQISGSFHKAYYGHWLGYDHKHHPDCCHGDHSNLPKFS